MYLGNCSAGVVIEKSFVDVSSYSSLGSIMISDKHSESDSVDSRGHLDTLGLAAAVCLAKCAELTAFAGAFKTVTECDNGPASYDTLIIGPY